MLTSLAEEVLLALKWTISSILNDVDINWRDAQRASRGRLTYLNGDVTPLIVSFRARREQ